MRKRRKSTGPKPTITTRHFMGNPPDGVAYLQSPGMAAPPGREWIYRLSMSDRGTDELDEQAFASDIAASEGNAAFFIDANLFIAPTDQYIWDNLIGVRKLFITPGVLREISPWVNDPRDRNLATHAIVSALRTSYGPRPIEVYTPPRIYYLTKAFEYYVTLLSFRKLVSFELRSQYVEEFSSEPDNQQLSNYMKSKIGERGLSLAKDGAEALNAKSPNFFNDEELVVSAYMHAITTGRETFILSRDGHIQDQFVKLKTRLVDHYCSMAIADRYASDPLSLKPRPMPMDNPFVCSAFRGSNNLLISRPAGGPPEVVPINHYFYNQPVNVYSLLLRRPYTLTCFAAETGIWRLFNIKGSTNGLSTERAEGRNCHVWMGRPLVDILGNHAAIAEEHSVESQGVQVGLLDVNLVVNNNEGFMHLRPVDPRLVILPQSDASEGTQ